MLIKGVPPIEAIKLERKRRLVASDFYAYRKLIMPKMQDSWWQMDAAKHLMQFKDDMENKRSPILIIQAPPQHGKSEQITDFVSWYLGMNPDTKCIYASFSERLGVRANLKLQKLMSSPIYEELFPQARINSSNVVTKAGMSLRNREIFEMVGHDGYFRNTTVRGSITGESLDLGVIDDPIKGREAANSITIRDRTWDWLMDDFFTRFSDGAGLLVILTRWHMDDPIGRLIERFPKAKVLTYKAIAEVDEEHRKAGEALFPEHKSIDFLLDRKKIMDAANWEALYQQNPVVAGGNLFKISDFQLYRDLPTIKWRGVYVDTAQKTGEKNDYTVMQEWGLGEDGKAYLLDMVRAKLEAPELEKTAIAFWNKCRGRKGSEFGTLRKMAIEDKVSGTGLIQVLKRIAVPVVAIKRNRDKYTRALDIIPSVAAGLVCLPASATWLKDMQGEIMSFPDGTHDDTIDPMMDAVVDMLFKSSYTLDHI